MKDDEASNAKIEVELYQQAALTEHTHNYKGLRIHALKGLHEYISMKVKSHFNCGSRLLDMAAGSGAMTQRLIDAGYSMTATDYVSENFRLHETVSFFKSDLNQFFSLDNEENFDGIVAMEIIEHLENPRHFARECFKLLKPGGTLILSTPNLDNFASIFSLIRFGHFNWFGDREYKLDGHITPLTQWQIKKCFHEAGFICTEESSYGDPYGPLRGSLRLMLLSNVVRAFHKKETRLANEIYVAIFKRP